MSGGLAATARGGGDRGEGSRGQVCGARGGRQEGAERQDQGHLQARSQQKGKGGPDHPSP